MTLMDLALETKDYEWAKQLYKLDDKLPTDSKEIKCELAETTKSKNKNGDYLREDVIQELQDEGLYEDYLMLANFLKGLDDNTKRIFIRGCLAKPNKKDVELALNIIKVLGQ